MFRATYKEVRELVLPSDIRYPPYCILVSDLAGSCTTSILQTARIQGDPQTAFRCCFTGVLKMWAVAQWSRFGASLYASLTMLDFSRRQRIAVLRNNGHIYFTVTS